MTDAPSKVFISYSHDTVEHQERVLSLADRLRADGIDAEVDQYNAAPSEGWPLWCERQIEAADVVLMVCTETYYRRVSGDEGRGKGLGVVWEAAIIRQLLYDAGAVSDKFVPVLFSDTSPEHIPTPIKGGTRYVVDTEDGYEDLYRRLTGQPHLLRPALGTIRPLPTRRRQWPKATMQAASPAPKPPPAPDHAGSMRTGTLARTLWQSLRQQKNRQVGRWPLLLILIVPMLFFFVQEYFGLTFRDTVRNWLLWVGTGVTFVILAFTFLGATLGSTGKSGRLWAPGILITVGAALAFSGYEKRKAISLTDFVDQEHQQIVQALTEWIPDALNGDDKAQVLLGELYAKGILPGGPRFDLAKTLYESSAKKGNKRAATNLQIMYEEGMGVEKNTTLSIYWRARGLLGGEKKIPIELLRFAVDDHIIQQLVELG